MPGNLKKKKKTMGYRKREVLEKVKLDMAAMKGENRALCEGRSKRGFLR